MTTKLTTTNIGNPEKEQLKKLAIKHSMSQVDFINACIIYFSNTPISPCEPPTSVQYEINKLRKRLDQIIGFIRTHEEKRLNPLLNNMIVIERRLRETNFNLQIDNLIDAHKDLYGEIGKQVYKLEQSFGKLINILKNEDIVAKERYEHQIFQIDQVFEMQHAASQLLINKGMMDYKKEDVERIYKIKKNYANYKI
ncbi:BfmA/BtgA family mobilization protein [Ancylomarina sp. YFZ004]